MDNELREILTQLVDTTNKLVEGQKRTDEHFQKVDERLDKMSTDISNLKETQKQMSVEIKSIKPKLENGVSNYLKSLCEMLLENSKRLRILENDMREFKDQLAVGEVLYSLKESDYL